MSLNKEQIAKQLHVFKFEFGSYPNPLKLINNIFLENEFKQKLNLLKTNGYLDLGKIISDDLCNKISAKIDDEISNKNHIDVKDAKIYLIKYFHNLEELLNQINNENVMKIINLYFARSVFISDLDIRRVLPANLNNIKNSSSLWHKDSRGRQLKLMIYFKDVGVNDSCFSFIPKTHKKRAYGLEETRMKIDETKSEYKIKNWIAKKGNAMLFDTNLIHILRRKGSGNYRDSLTIYYTPGHYKRKIYLKNKNNLNNKIKKIMLLD